VLEGVHAVFAGGLIKNQNDELWLRLSSPHLTSPLLPSLTLPPPPPPPQGIRASVLEGVHAVFSGGLIKGQNDELWRLAERLGVCLCTQSPWPP
jgi:hypothetical protein